MEKVILIFSFMGIGVNIISGKEQVREEERGVYLQKRQINRIMHKFQSPFIRKNKDARGRPCWWYCGNTQTSRGLQRSRPRSSTATSTHISLHTSGGTAAPAWEGRAKAS